MVDKIYSRPRIKMKKFRYLTKREKLKKMIMYLCFFFCLFLLLIAKAAYPVFVASCETAAASNATNILNKEVNEVMIVYNYNDLVNLGKDEKR